MRTIAGATPRAPSRARGVQVFSSLGARVTDPLRDAKYEAARIRIANAAMIPSRVWNDTSVWTSGAQFRRTLLIGGRFAPPRYRLETNRSVPNPVLPAESRHIINLTRLSDDSYAWDTEVMYSLGASPAADIAAFTRALFAAAEHRDEKDVRADYMFFAPKTTAAFGQVFKVDSIRTSHLPDTTTLAAYYITLDPRGVASRLPNFARYLRKYYLTARTRWSITDREGSNYFEFAASDGHLSMRVRTRSGQMVALAGPARPMPDTLTINGELTLRMRRFTVGVREYHPELTIVHTDGEAAWSVVSRREPEWVLPFITERLLRSPLRRPFEGNGSMFRIGVRDSVGGQTILLRRLHLEVQESTLMRFVGRLGATAVSDYQGLAEREQHIWLREVFDGIVADLAALGGSAGQ